MNDTIPSPFSIYKAQVLGSDPVSATVALAFSLGGQTIHMPAVQIAGNPSVGISWLPSPGDWVLVAYEPGMQPQVLGPLSIGGALIPPLAIGEVRLPPRRVVTVTTDYIATYQDDTIVMNAAGHTVTLPAPVGIARKSYTIKNAASGASTAVASVGYTFDGHASPWTPSSLSAAWGVLHVFSDGSEYLTE